MDSDYSSIYFRHKLDGFTPLTRDFYDIFSDEEIRTILTRRREMRRDRSAVAFLSFENSHAILGGLGAVSKHLPAALVRGGNSVLMLTPYYENNPRVHKALGRGELVERISPMEIEIYGRNMIVSCFAETQSTVPVFHIGVQGKFTASGHPYEYGDARLLLWDSLAFCAVVPSVLSRLGYTENIVFHANDWQTGLISVSSKCAMLEGTLQSAVTVLTLHNSYDAALSDPESRSWFGRPLGKPTVLQNAIAYLDGPLTTVSAPFALELQHDPIQSRYFAAHLQPAFSRNSPLGIENGPFGTVRRAFGERSLRAAAHGDIQPILKRKFQWRKALIDICREMGDARAVGRLNLRTATKAPILFMSGRLDPAQKGFDVLFQAIRELPPGTVKLLFSPSDASAEAISFYSELAEECRGDIAIWPFRLSGPRYRSCLRGASYLVMPSLYEPFGAATEGVLQGTPVIARATGGLWMQVHTTRSCVVPEYYRGLVDTPSPEPTGLLFREEYQNRDLDLQWIDILRTPPRNRLGIPLYRAVVESAREALLDAVAVYRAPEQYAALIANGQRGIHRFSWTESSNRYSMVYDRACSHI